jgi:hypothetical protein
LRAANIQRGAGEALNDINGRLSAQLENPRLNGNSGRRRIAISYNSKNPGRNQAGPDPADSALIGTAATI